MSGIGPLQTPSETPSIVTPVAFGFGLRPPGAGGEGHRRRGDNDANDEDTPIIQRR